MSHLPSNPSEAFKRRNPQIYGVPGTGSDEQDAGAKTPAPAHRPEAKLNKLERDWLTELRNRYAPPNIGIQDTKLRIPAGHWYQPDFRTVSIFYREVTFWETKGPHRFREKGINKLLAAAATHRWARFVLVERVNSQWKETVIEV